jgi:hypothetical protein
MRRTGSGRRASLRQHGERSRGRRLSRQREREEGGESNRQDADCGEASQRQNTSIVPFDSPCDRVARSGQAFRLALDVFPENPRQDSASVYQSACGDH